MILISHPTGNHFVRACLKGLEDAGMLESFHTSLAFQESDWFVQIAPPAAAEELLRRSYSLPKSKIFQYPGKELIRLAAPKCGLGFLTAGESGWASIDSVFKDIDISAANYLAKQFSSTANTSSINGVYCYEDAAYRTFKEAHKLGLKCFYDLPIAYWETVQKLLKEERERLPEWEATLGGTRDSKDKLKQKTEELAMADLIVCPSKFVYASLPADIRNKKTAIITEFGSPITNPARLHDRDMNGPLRVLFAGSMTQRKGLADLFSAMKMLKRSDIELVVMGSPIMPLDFYYKQFSDFKYEKPRPHQQVLNLMQSCHVLVLPSIVEGRALVQQEAMICGLPIIVTANAGAEDLVIDGQTGFLVPIRCPESIADRINWIADNRYHLKEMSNLARQKASEITWSKYSQKIVRAIQDKFEQGSN